MQPATNGPFVGDMTYSPEQLVYVYVPVKTSPKVYHKYLHGPSTALGTAQVVFGVLCIMFNAISVGYSSFHIRGVYGHGFWNGILFIVTGILGLLAGKKKTKSPIVAYMVMCIVSSVASATIVSIGVVAASEIAAKAECHASALCDDYNMEIAMEACMAISGFVESILCIFGAALGCKVVVCGSSDPAQDQEDYSSNDHSSSNGQVIYLAKNQRAQYAFGPSNVMMPHRDLELATCQTTSVHVTWVHPLSQPRTSVSVSTYPATDPCPPYSVDPPNTSQP